MAKEALVVKREILFKDKSFEGFLALEEHDFTSDILKNFFYHERGDKLENDSSLKQIIPYVLIVNPETKKIFAYRRANNQNYSEKRLRNKWSFGLGGHIERQDNGNPIVSGMIRELHEEVKMKEYPEPKIVGYLNDDSGDVEKVHFGILALAETNQDVQKGDEEMAEGRFMSFKEMESLFADSKNEFDKWTRISWPYVKQYMQSK